MLSAGQISKEICLLFRVGFFPSLSYRFFRSKNADTLWIWALKIHFFHNRLGYRKEMPENTETLTVLADFLRIISLFYLPRAVFHYLLGIGNFWAVWQKPASHRVVSYHPHPSYPFMSISASRASPRGVTHLPAPPSTPCFPELLKCRLTERQYMWDGLQVAPATWSACLMLARWWCSNHSFLLSRGMNLFLPSLCSNSLAFPVVGTGWRVSDMFAKLSGGMEKESNTGYKKKK